jgi:formylglycine-generating enzyme required for sulfatase activity
VTITNGQTQQLGGTLGRLKGGVKILSDPPEAEIYLNGKMVGVTPMALVDLDADDYTLTLKKEGYGDYTQTIRIREGMFPNLNVTLENITVPEGMVLIPAGEFEMGSNDYDDEKPVHTVYLDAFYMDKYEVTNAQYVKFLNDYGKNTDAAGHKLLDIDSEFCLIEKVGNTYRPKSGYENHPVIEVSWYGAAAYAQFYGKRLPTEAEWEKAARGGLVGKKYPWGDEAYKGKASFGSGLKPVGSFAPNGYGLYDMAGNVWEWCADEYDSGYYSKSPKNNPKGPGITITFKNNDFTSVTIRRVLRGGSWCRYPGLFRCSGRNDYRPTYACNDIGFRCSQDR